MDHAPLVEAHVHARKAVSLTLGSNLLGAKEEHDLAAHAFSQAKETTADAEALRILNLLQHNHEQLAGIIQQVQSTVHAPPTNSAAKTSDATKESSAVNKASSSAPHVPKLQNRSSTSPVRTRRLHRESSSNIADNLARQRRGLPAGPELSSQQASGRILSHIERPGYNSRTVSPDRSRKSAAPSLDDSPPPTEHGTALTADDDRYRKFMHAFGGLFPKISPYLAFTGLPLDPDGVVKESPPEKTKRNDKTTRASASDEPDLNKIFSPAVMRAISQDAGPSFGPQESFYLVPPTGGTVSYAGMVSGARGSVLLPDAIAEDDDEFVDARENLGPPSPRSIRGSRQVDRHSPAASRETMRKANPNLKKEASSKEQQRPPNNTLEELELKVTALQDMLDVQAKRLRMWEMSSQSQSMALQQSMRAVRERPDLPSLGGPAVDLDLLDKINAASAKPASPPQPAPPSAADLAKIEDLEAQIEKERRKCEDLETKSARVESENARLQSTVAKYRDKWEQLKAGARRREEDKRRVVGGGGGGGGSKVTTAADGNATAVAGPGASSAAAVTGTSTLGLAEGS